MLQFKDDPTVVPPQSAVALLDEGMYSSCYFFITTWSYYLFSHNMSDVSSLSDPNSTAKTVIQSRRGQREALKKMKMEEKKVAMIRNVEVLELQKKKNEEDHQLKEEAMIMKWFDLVKNSNNQVLIDKSHQLAQRMMEDRLAKMSNAVNELL